MRIAVHFIFLPTAELAAAASLVGEKRLVEPSVWTTHENDRTGLKHSQAELEESFWLEFVANLFYSDENTDQKKFRGFCLESGFHKCWNVVSTKGGGPAEDLVMLASEARKFLKSQKF